MKRLHYNFGDIHFNSMNPYKYQAGENFIEWFDKHDFGDPQYVEFSFVGDIAEKAENPGNTVDQVDRFFTIASRKACHIDICMGNHDKKKYHDGIQHSLVFLQNKGNITIHEDATEFVSALGFKILMLPWRRTDGMGKTLHEYYSELVKQYEGNTYDVIIGHWNIMEEEGPKWARNGVDISCLKTKCWAIGHVHTRTRPEYIGSVFPNNTKEQDDDRPSVYNCIDEDGNVTEYNYPHFLRYVTLPYGSQVPEEEPSCAYAYTITNCESLGEAMDRYPNINIKGIEREKLIEEDIQVSTASVEGESFIESPHDAIPSMIRETGIKCSRPVLMLLMKTFPKEN